MNLDRLEQSLAECDEIIPHKNDDLDFNMVFLNNSIENPNGFSKLRCKDGVEREYRPET